MASPLGLPCALVLSATVFLSCSSSPSHESTPAAGAGGGSPVMGGTVAGSGGSVANPPPANGGSNQAPDQPPATAGSAAGGADMGVGGMGGSATTAGSAGAESGMGDELPPCHATTPVTSSGELQAALAAAQPGACIELADGNYSFPTITQTGSEAAPIVVRAANPRGAVVNEGAILFMNAAYVVLEGLDITTSGESSDLYNGGTNGILVSFTDSQHCRLTRSRLHPEGHPNDRDWVVITGDNDCSYNRVDYNEFGPQNTIANMIMIDGGGREEPPTAGQVCQHNRIDHNYIHDVNYGGGNNWEAIRIGRSWQGPSEGFNIIEFNLLDGADGDPETISVKSSANIVRHNTMVDTNGQFTLRHGNDTQVYGNYILNSDGIRVYGADHRIYNNYINSSQIWLDDGSAPETDEPGKAHYQVHRAWVFNNTLVGASIRIGGSKAYAPSDCRIANNLIVNGNINGGGNGTETEGNIVGGDNPLTMQDGIFRLLANDAGGRAIDAAVNSGFYEMLTHDIDGQPRETPDVGADEQSEAPMTAPGPLTPQDVGMEAP